MRQLMAVLSRNTGDDSINGHAGLSELSGRRSLLNTRYPVGLCIGSTRFHGSFRQPLATPIGFGDHLRDRMSRFALFLVLEGEAGQLILGIKSMSSEPCRVMIKNIGRAQTVPRGVSRDRNPAWLFPNDRSRGSHRADASRIELPAEDATSLARGARRTGTPDPSVCQGS
jgi:hypothetical protein